MSKNCVLENNLFLLLQGDRSLTSSFDDARQTASTRQIRIQPSILYPVADPRFSLVISSDPLPELKRPDAVRRYVLAWRATYRVK